jgi:hypothetical protein
MTFAGLMGEHSGCINDVVPSPASQGHCARHRLLNHSCFLYTCCDDRTVRVGAGLLCALIEQWMILWASSRSGRLRKGVDDSVAALSCCFPPQVWDTVENQCVAVVDPPTRKCSTVRSVALSARHLFLGSSRGQIYVYTLERVCERTDIHICKQPDVGPQPFCLQTSLAHGDTLIRCLTTAGPSFSRKYLLSGYVTE